MEEIENNFEAVTLANVWIKEHILDIIKEINRYEIIAEGGGLDFISTNEAEAIEILRVRIDALGNMKAYILQLRDNVWQYLDRTKKLKIELGLKRIDDHPPLLENNVDFISHNDNFYLSPNFQIKLNKLRKIKSILIQGCGEAELLMPKKDKGKTEKKVLEEDEE